MQGQPRKYTKNCKVFHIFAEVIKFKIHKIQKVGHKQDVLSTAAQIAVKHCPKDTRHFRPYEFHGLYKLYEPINYAVIKILSK